MDNSLFWIPLAAGLEDGVNPCVLMTCVAFVLYHFWLSAKSVVHSALWRGVWIGLLVLSSMVLNLGVGQEVLFLPVFQKTVQMMYLMAGVVAVIGGVILLVDWFRLRRGLLGRPLFSSKPVSLVMVWVVTVVSALLLSVLATLWPMSYYITILANFLVIPGKFTSVALFFVLYTLLFWWPLYLLGWFMAPRMPQGLTKIVYASVFLSAGIGAIVIFH